MGKKPDKGRYNIEVRVSRTWIVTFTFPCAKEK